MALVALLHAACCPMAVTLFSGLLQLPIPLSLDLLLTDGKPVLRREVANGGCVFMTCATRAPRSYLRKASIQGLSWRFWAQPNRHHDESLQSCDAGDATGGCNAV